MRVLATALCLALLAGAARAGEEDDLGLGPRLQKKVTEAGRAYFEPDVEFLWRLRKDFLEALDEAGDRLGIDPIADIPWLRRAVMQTRGFLPPFDDKRRQRNNETVEVHESGIYLSVKSERWRFTCTLPPSRARRRGLDRRVRTSPLPLLLAVHDEHDARDAADHPGRTALRNRFPRKAFRDLHDRWFFLAPVAPPTGFLEADGTIRHQFLTAVLTEFWRRYHVDFDRIVIDGGAPAAAFAAAFPHVLAGLVLRGHPTIDPDVVRNYANVPVFVAGDGAYAEQLETFGHPDVTTGDDEALVAWLEKRSRTVPTRFAWRLKSKDHKYSHWIHVLAFDDRRVEATLQVRVVDTAIDPNTIRIEARGIETVAVYLNDQILDLDRPVRLVVNGRERLHRPVERDFGRLFEKEPDVRKNMNFGWLYTALLEDVSIEGDARGPSVVLGAEDEARAARYWEKAEAAEREGNPVKARLYYEKVLALGETSFRDRALERLDAVLGGLPGDVRLAAEREWLEGRPDRLERHLGQALETRTAEAALPFALRDLWWRRTDGHALREHLEGLRWSGLLSDQYLWILGGGVGPYPTAAAGDPWPILSALVRERQQRETTGARWLPDESPVLRRKLTDQPAEWQDWYRRLCTWFYEDWMRPAYEGEDAATLDDDTRAELAAQDRLARDTRVRNLWLVLIAGLLFVGGAFSLSRRLSTDE